MKSLIPSSAPLHFRPWIYRIITEVPSTGIHIRANWQEIRKMRKQKSFSSDKKRRNGRHLAVRTPIRIPLPMALANRFLEDIRFEQLLNEELDWDEEQWNVSPGTLCKAIILSTFEISSPNLPDSRPIYGHGYGGPFGGGSGKRVAQCPRTCASYGPPVWKRSRKFFRILALTAMTVYNIAFERLHTDTTTISFYGEYEGTEEDVSWLQKVDELKVDSTKVFFT